VVATSGDEAISSGEMLSEGEQGAFMALLLLPCSEITDEVAVTVEDSSSVTGQVREIHLGSGCDVGSAPGKSGHRRMRTAAKPPHCARYVCSGAVA